MKKYLLLVVVLWLVGLLSNKLTAQTVVVKKNAPATKTVAPTVKPAIKSSAKTAVPSPTTNIKKIPISVVPKKSVVVPPKKITPLPPKKIIPKKEVTKTDFLGTKPQSVSASNPPTSPFSNSSSTLYDGSKNSYEVSAGIGLGMDYGYIGIKGEGFINKFKYAVLFAGVGYVPVVSKVGFNVGIKLCYVKRQSMFQLFKPYVAGMYGSNFVLLVQDNGALNKIFYGLTFGVGTEIHLKKIPKLVFDVGISFPMISITQVDDYLLQHKLKRNTDLGPVGVMPTIGARWIIK